jgi:predicted nucleic acid-binding protein
LPKPSRQCAARWTRTWTWIFRVSAFDFAAARRWARFAPDRTLARRGDDQLPFASPEAAAGGPLLLDTCVYIDQMQKRAPPLVEQLVAARQVNHSTVAIQELMHTVGRLNPADKRTPSVVKAIQLQIEAMPDHRAFAPDAEVQGRAALLAGVLCRLQGYARDARLRALHDCVLFLQAQKLGFTVLTANIVDFDLLLQMLPRSRVLFYRTD